VTEEGKFAVRDEAAAAVRRIFALARDGLGLQRIVKRLNEEGVPPIGNKGRWIKRYVHLILTSPAAMGTYQPKRKDGRRSVPDGEPIANHYLAVVSAEEWQEAQAALSSRSDGRGAGRVSEGEANLFAGLVRCASTGEKMHLLRITAPRRNGIQKRHTYLAADQGVATKGAKLGVDYSTFEAAVLSRLREIRPVDIVGPSAGDEDRAAEDSRLSGRLIDLDARIEKTKARARKTEDFDGYLDLIEGLRKERKQVAERLAELSQERETGRGADVGEMHTLIDLLASAKPEHVEELRRRLKLRLLHQLSEILVLTVRRGRTRLHAIQLFWRVGGHHRSYLLLSRPGKGWSVRSFADVHQPDDFDLRRKKNARDLEKVLLAVDLSDLTES
jgi:hypothetical protein